MVWLVLAASAVDELSALADTLSSIPAKLRVAAVWSGLFWLLGFDIACSEFVEQKSVWCYAHIPED